MQRCTPLLVEHDEATGTHTERRGPTQRWGPTQSAKLSNQECMSLKLLHVPLQKFNQCGTLFEVEHDAAPRPDTELRGPTQSTGAPAPDPGRRGPNTKRRGPERRDPTQRAETPHRAPVPNTKRRGVPGAFSGEISNLTVWGTMTMVTITRVIIVDNSENDKKTKNQDAHCTANSGR